MIQCLLINLKWALNLYRHDLNSLNFFLWCSADFCTQFCRKTVFTAWHMCRNKAAIFQSKLFLSSRALNQLSQKILLCNNIFISNISHIHKNFIDIHDLTHNCNRNQCRKKEKGALHLSWNVIPICLY